MKKIRIGLAGLGVVGSGVYEIIQNNSESLNSKLFSENCQFSFEITAVAARSKKDFLDPKIKFYHNVIDLANDPNVDVVIELIGGCGVAKDLIETSIKKGKKVVTANKALLAEHGFEIAQLLEKYNGYIGLEASSAGAIPVVKVFKESLVAHEIKVFYGILNGTCNFILTKMKDESLAYEEALKKAQRLGYAESDPTLDVNGFDSAHKLAILSSIVGGTKPALKQTYIEGIEEVCLDDIMLADELDYKIKLMTVYKKSDQSIEQWVYPALVSKKEKISQIDDSYNAIIALTKNADWSMLVGRGAGSLPTASAVVADLIDIALERDKSFLFNRHSSQLKYAELTDISQRFGRYFLRIIFDKKLLSEKTSGGAFGTGLEFVFEGLNYDATKEKEMINFSDVIFKELPEGKMLCGFLTFDHKESEIIEAIKNLTTGPKAEMIKLVKFLRVEETKF